MSSNKHNNDSFKDLVRVVDEMLNSEPLLSNWDMVALVKSAPSDSLAFAQLFHQYEPIVFRIMRDYFIPSYTREDWLQECGIALIEAAQRYEGSKGSKFGPWYRLVIVSRISSMIRQNCAEKRGGTEVEECCGAAQDIEESLSVSGFRYATWHDDLSDMRLDIQEYVLGLSVAERRALFNCAHGESPADHKMARALERARRKWLKYRLGD